jgi:hypothetical protein
VLVTNRKALAAITASLATLATAMSASAGSSPAPGGVYWLTPGIYVQQGIDCGSPPNAAIRQYDGRGLSDPHSRSCRAHILSRQGNRFDVVQSCIDAGSGPAPRVVEHQRVTVPDVFTFAITTGGSAITYRYCPAKLLPADLRRYQG